MKLIIVLMVTASLQVSAKSFAQRITLNEHKASLKTVIKEIRKQSGYDFFYDLELVQKSKLIDVEVKNASIEETLDKCLSGQNLVYTINDKIVVIKEKEPALTDRVIAVSADIVIHGKVLDAQGNPASGITVTIKGTKRSTVTNKDGEFLIKAEKGNDVLVFTSVEMETLEVNLNERTDLTVSLKPKNTLLGGVTIATGFQSIAKEQMTGATATVTSTELEQRYQPNILNNLEGRVPGLVNYRGTTEIRGVSTLQASTAVLIVVDGLPIEGTIANINPYDVESITVLKDAAAAAIYGARASNGVIVIITKKAKEKRTVIEFSGDVTITNKPDIGFHLLTAAQQVDLESGFWQYNYFSGLVPTPVATTTTNINNGNSITPVQYAYYQLAQGQITQAQLTSQLNALKQNNFRQQYTDNALLKDVLQQYNLAIRTSTDKLQSSIVVNYKTDNTGIINSYNNQLNLFYKGTYTATKWLNINYGVNTVLGQGNSSNSNFATSANDVSPYLQLLDANGNHVQYTTADFNPYNTVPQTTPQLQSLMVNHLDELALDRIKSKTLNTRYYVNADVKIIPGLTFNPYFQYESNQYSTSAYSESNSYAVRLLNDLYTSRTGTAPNYTYSYLLPTTGGKLATTQTNGYYWTARGQLNYSHEFGKHAITIIAGTEFRQTSSSGTKGLLLGYDNQLQSQSTSSVNFSAISLLNNPTLVKPTYGLAGTYAGLANSIGLIRDTTHRYASGYANASYTYDRKYTAFGSIRKDYADLFGLDPKFRGKPLWSVGAAWNIFNESFMQDMVWVNFLKFRASYGVTGNINTNASSYLTATTGTVNLLTQLPQAVVATAENPYLRWEKTSTVNLGIDFTLLKNRLNGSIDWYRKNSTDLFAPLRLDPATGFTSFTVNNGGLLNNGIELSLDYTWLKPHTRDGFSWSTQVVVSHNNNKITYVDQLATAPLDLTEGAYKVGYSAHALFSLQYKGLNTVGQPQWLKADGTLTTLALSNNDLSAVVYSGQTDPENNIGLTNQFSFKGFTLNILMVYYGGQSLRAEVPSVAQAPSYGAMPSFLLSSWTPTNTNTIIPGFGQYVPPAAVPAFHLAYSDAFVRAGDFLKIRNAVLGYNLPLQLARKIGSDRVNVHFQLDNPKALWMKNTIGIDPETGGAPIPTSYVFGFSVNY